MSDISARVANSPDGRRGSPLGDDKVNKRHCPPIPPTSFEYARWYGGISPDSNKKIEPNNVHKLIHIAEDDLPNITNGRKLAVDDVYAILSKRLRFKEFDGLRKMENPDDAYAEIACIVDSYYHRKQTTLKVIGTLSILTALSIGAGYFGIYHGKDISDFLRQDKPSVVAPYQNAPLK